MPYFYDIILTNNFAYNGGVNVSNKPKKMVRNPILDEPMSKGKPIDIETLNAMKQAVIRARKISKREIAENEREARQFLKGKIIK